MYTRHRSIGYTMLIHCDCFSDCFEITQIPSRPHHPLLNETDDTKRSALARQAANLARLSQGLLEGEELTAFIQDGYAQLHQA